jgi:UDP-GlcNAc:undecaprenyl-phosphate GlcNAc-1-phosphate transferase
VAYLGGVGILLGLAFGIMAGIYRLQGTEHFRMSFRLLLGVLAGGSIACFIGVVDDIFDIKPRHKLLGQVCAALMLVVVGVLPNFSSIANTIGWGISARIDMAIGIPVVIIFVLGATNSLNLLDGLDGLCAGVTAIIGIAMLLLSIHLATWDTSGAEGPVRIILCLGLIGGVFGFLPFNRHPAKIFMGDAGSMLLGFVIAALMILFGAQIPRWWLASIVVFGLPILDTATALVRRLINKKPLFVSDRGHIYDQMIDRGMSLRKTVVLCYVLASGYALTGLVMSQIRGRYALVVYVVVFAISGVVIWKKGFLQMEGLRGAIKK